MVRKGRDFELKYRWLYEMNDNYVVTSPAFLYDRATHGKREVDVLVEYKDDNDIMRKIGIECRDRKSPVDVMGVEQLLQKKEDLGLDCLIISTTNRFTEQAKQKAAYYGIVIERAEKFDENSIEAVSKQFFADFYFFKFELHKFYLVMKDQTIIGLNTFLKNLNSALLQHALVNEINTNFYLSIDPDKIICDYNLNREDFFKNEDSNICLEGRVNADGILEGYDFLKDVKIYLYKVKVVPYRVSLPLSDFISTFGGNANENKNYRAHFGNEVEYLDIGYLGQDVYVNFNLVNRNNKRLVRGEFNLNTIFPRDANIPEFDMEEIERKYMGKFDFSCFKE